MRTGDIFEAADVLKHLTYLSHLKPLSFREQRMLERARYLVISELAAVCRQPECNIEPRVEQALTRACVKHDRRPARARRRGSRRPLVNTGPLAARVGLPELAQSSGRNGEISTSQEITRFFHPGFLGVRRACVLGALPRVL